MSEGKQRVAMNTNQPYKLTLKCAKIGTLPGLRKMSHYRRLVIVMNEAVKPILLHKKSVVTVRA